MSTATEGRPGRARFPVGAVLIAGTILGAAYVRGFHPHLTGVPVLSPVLGALAAVAGGIALAAVAWPLIRRYHRPAAAHAWRHSQRAATAAGRVARTHGGPPLARWMERVRGRWDRRHPPAGEAIAPPAAAPPAVTPPLAVVPVAAPVAAAPAQNGAIPMTATDPAPVTPLPRRGVQPAMPAASATWRAVAISIAEFDPESESDIVERFRAEAAGIAAYAEGVTDLIEHLHSRRFAAASLALLNDAADKIADASADVLAEIARFLGFYEHLVAHAAERGHGTVPDDPDFFDGSSA